MNNNVFSGHPLPWALSDNKEIIEDADGGIVVSDGTGAFLAFDEETGRLIVDAVNEKYGG